MTLADYLASEAAREDVKRKMPKSRNGRGLNLAGQRFGKLVAIEPLGIQKRGIMWRCHCDCGRICEVVARALRYGDTASCGCSRRQGTTEERFWRQVKKNAGDGCWEWIGTRAGRSQAFQYGRFFVDGRTVPAHRWAYESHAGYPVGNLLVLHRCDNPPCVRPEHLFLGTQADNSKDMDNKGRRIVGISRGEANGKAQLTNEKVMEIRRLYRTGMASILARQFGVGKTTILSLVNRESWSHV